MNRREFIAGLGGACASCAIRPRVARAQQPTMPVVGFLIFGTPETTPDIVAGFRRGMSDAGFVEGRNVAVDYRWYDDPARRREVVADLVRRHVAVIAASSALSAEAARASTASIPIVFWAAADAVQIGLVRSLARPGGNVTGINSMSAELGPKRLELLHALVPRAQHFGVLVQPGLPASETNITAAQAAATGLGLQPEVLFASTASEIDAAFIRAVEKRVDALLVTPSRLFASRRVQLTTLTARHAIPTIFPQRSFAEIGGLMSYDSSLTDEYRQVGIYISRILKGEKPADLPVLQPNKFEFVINMQTARLLGIGVPAGLLAIADELIE